MAVQKGAYLRYSGPAQSQMVMGYGKFLRDEAKFVDYLTACAFRDERCAAEGWEVSDEPFTSSDTRRTTVNSPATTKRDSTSRADAKEKREAREAWEHDKS